MAEPTKTATHALSVDLGGTFTDFSLLDLSTQRVLVHKVLTDPDNPLGGQVEQREVCKRAANIHAHRIG